MKYISFFFQDGRVTNSSRLSGNVEEQLAVSFVGYLDRNVNLVE